MNKNSQIEEKYENNLNKSPKQLRGGKKSVEIRNIENEKEKEYDNELIKALEIFYQRFIYRDNNLNQNDVSSYLLKLIPSTFQIGENGIVNLMNEEIDKTLQRVNNNRNLNQRVLKNEKNIDNLNEIYHNSYNEKKKLSNENEFYEYYNNLINDIINIDDNNYYTNEIYDDYVKRKNINEIYDSNIKASINYNRNLQNSNNNINHNNFNNSKNNSHFNNSNYNNSNLNHSPNRKLNNIPTFGNEDEKNINDKKRIDDNDSEFDI